MPSAAAAAFVRSDDETVVKPFPLSPSFSVNPDRRLSTGDLEVENAFKIDARLRNRLEGYFSDRGVPAERSTPNSLYLDGEKLDVVRHGLTLRDRPGGIADNGTVYQGVYSLKSRHVELQALADELTARLPAFDKVGIFTPIVRTEIERKNNHPRYASELRVRDLPKDIRRIVIERLGIKPARALVLKPTMHSPAVRKKYDFYLDPRQFEGMKDGHVPRFEDLTIVAQPTDEMKKSGQYMCLELSFDKISCRQPRRGAFIGDILFDKGKGSRVCRDIKERQVMEYEHDQRHSSPSLTDDKLVTTYVGFGLSLDRFDRELATRLKAEVDTKRGRKTADGTKPYKRLKGVPSKAVCGYDALVRSCHNKRGLRKAFDVVRHMAP